MSTKQSIAIVGAGWSGLTAALTLARRQDTSVTVFEANRIAGGRARTVYDGSMTWDNGQHLLISAYMHTLSMLESVGMPASQSCQHIPMQWIIKNGMHLRMNPHGWPWNILQGLRDTQNLSKKERYLLGWDMMALHRLRLHRHISRKHTVASWFAHRKHTQAWQDFWVPLCWATLNTEPERASINTLFEVIQQSFFKPLSGHYLLIPKIDLSSIFPNPAIRELTHRNAQILLGRRVKCIRATLENIYVDDQAFDKVILAVAPWHVTGIWAQAPQALDGIESRPISTVFARFNQPLSSPMVLGQSWSKHALWDWQIQRDDCSIAWVKSGGILKKDDMDWQQLGVPLPTDYKHIIEKRATFLASTERYIPQAIHANGRIILSGDYMHPSLPATLEGAVIMGLAAAQHASAA
jgi:squalene-associated FAD-dependent desaturase